MNSIIIIIMMIIIIIITKESQPPDISNVQVMRYVAVSRGYDTCFEEGLVMGHADCYHLMVLVETP